MTVFKFVWESTYERCFSAICKRNVRVVVEMKSERRWGSSTLSLRFGQAVADELARDGRSRSCESEVAMQAHPAASVCERVGWPPFRNVARLNRTSQYFSSDAETQAASSS